MAPHIARQMEKPNVQFAVVRHPRTHNIVSVAQWTMPIEERLKAELHETQEEKDERQEFDDEAYRKDLPVNSNKDLIMAFTTGLRNLRQQVLRGRRHFMLENLVTHPDHRGKGLASRLIEVMLLQADGQNALVYLSTASDNPAMRMYRKLGFEEQGRHTIENLGKFVLEEELKKHGGAEEHTHVAFIRYPTS